MFDKKQQIFTKVLTNEELVIKEEYGVTVVAMNLVSGSGFYEGIKKLGTIDSTPIPLVVNRPVTISSEQTKYIGDLTIDCSAGGVIEIIAR